MSIKAAIDVGTNSVQLVVGKRGADGIEILLDATVNARLGEGVDAAKRLNPTAMERAVDAIRNHVGKARELGAEQIRLFGTSAVREAENRDELISRVRDETDVTIEPLGVLDECRYSYFSVALDDLLKTSEDQQVVVDVGGGSTEIVYGVGASMGPAMSARIGAVRLTERFLKDPSSVCRLVDAAALTEKLIRTTATQLEVDRLVAIGGSAVNLARIWREVPVEETDLVHGLTMSYRDLRKVIDELYTLSSEERKKLVGLEPERADFILAGALIIDRVMACFDMQEFVVSARGLRHGALYEMLAEP